MIEDWRLGWVFKDLKLNRIINLNLFPVQQFIIMLIFSFLVKIL